MYSNQKLIEIYGCDNLDEFKALTGFTFIGMVHPEDFESITNSIVTQSKNLGEDYVEYRIIRKDGSIRCLDDYGKLVYGEEYGNLFYVFVSDITDYKETLRNVKKMKNVQKNFNTLAYENLTVMRLNHTTDIIEEIRGKNIFSSDYVRFSGTACIDPETGDTIIFVGETECTKSIVADIMKIRFFRNNMKW